MCPIRSNPAGGTKRHAKRCRKRHGLVTKHATSLKGAFIGFLPTTRAFATTTVHRWALNWLELGAREVATMIDMEIPRPPREDPFERSVGPLEREHPYSNYWKEAVRQRDAAGIAVALRPGPNKRVPRDTQRALGMVTAHLYI